jgi:hypothetical protein
MTLKAELLIEHNIELLHIRTKSSASMRHSLLVIV